MSELFSTARENAIKSYQKYKSYYDRKCASTPLELHSYCLLLDPKITNQNSGFEKQKSKWLPLFRVEKILTNNNYIVRRTNTNFTHCVHRIRLRPIKPKFPVQDISNIDPQDFQQDPELRPHQLEPELFDNTLQQPDPEDYDMKVPEKVQFNERDNRIVNIPMQDSGSQVTQRRNNSRASPHETDIFIVEGSDYEPAIQDDPECVEVPAHLLSQDDNFQTPSETNHSNYNFRQGDKRTAVRLQCAEHLQLNSMIARTETPETQRESRIEFFLIPPQAEDTIEIGSLFDTEELTLSSAELTEAESFDETSNDEVPHSDDYNNSRDESSDRTSNDEGSIDQRFIDDDPFQTHFNEGGDNENTNHTLSRSASDPNLSDETSNATMRMPEITHYTQLGNNAKLEQTLRRSTSDSNISDEKSTTDTARMPDLMHQTGIRYDKSPERPVTQRIRLEANPISPIFNEPMQNVGVIREQPQSPITDDEQPMTSTPFRTPIARQLRPRNNALSYNWRDLEIQVRRRQTEKGQIENLLTLGPKSPDRE